MNIPIVILILIALFSNIIPTTISYNAPPPPTAVRSTVILNEVMANADDEDTGEFVELYNPGAVPVDVLNWYVQDAADTNDQIVDYTGSYDWGLSGTTIPAGGYCLYVDPEYSGDYNWYLNQNVDVSKVIMVTTSQYF